MRDAPIKNELLDVIKEKYRASYVLSEKIGDIMSRELAIARVPDDEIGYLAIYVEKLRKRKMA
jgi:transcriptional antiterminator